MGRWIVTHHAIPDINRFYYSATTGYGYDYSWLSQVMLFSAYRWLDGAGIALLSSIVAGFIFYVFYKLLEPSSENMLVNFVLLCLALVTTTVYLTGRPMMFTVAFFALEVLLLSGWVDAGSRVAGWRRHLIWLMPPMVAVWANLHPGFAVAPLLILVFMPLGTKARDRWTLAACLAATLVAIVANPYGWRMYLMPIETARSMSMLHGLAEWTGVSGPEAIIWGGLVALVTCGLALRRQPLMVILLAAGAAIAAGLSNRNMALFGVVVVYVVGRALVPALMPILRRMEIVRKFDVRFENVGGWFWVLVLPLLLAGSVRLGAAPMDLTFDFSAYPADAVRHIENSRLSDNIFVRETWSGYLLWEMPDRRLFFDAKGGFSRKAAVAHTDLIKPRADWQAATDNNGISTFLLERDSPLAVVLGENAGWRREYTDSLSEIFVRGSGGPD